MSIQPYSAGGALAPQTFSPQYQVTQPDASYNYTLTPQAEREVDPLRLRAAGIVEGLSHREESELEALLVKQDGYIARLFSDETWGEWLESRTPLGRIVDAYLGSSTAMFDSHLLERAEQLFEAATCGAALTAGAIGSMAIQSPVPLAVGALQCVQGTSANFLSTAMSNGGLAMTRAREDFERRRSSGHREADISQQWFTRNGNIHIDLPQDPYPADGYVFTIKPGKSVSISGARGVRLCHKGVAAWNQEETCSYRGPSLKVKVVDGSQTKYNDDYFSDSIERFSVYGTLDLYVTNNNEQESTLYIWCTRRFKEDL
jgi:hypothetical protein